jgi:hypothetical protein
LKNVQIIDGAVNSVFEIYEVDDYTFDEIFVDDQDTVFLSDIHKYSDFTEEESVLFWKKVYSCRKDKKEINGIHGTLHLDGSNCKKEYFPEGKESLVIQSLLS